MDKLTKASLTPLLGEAVPLVTGCIRPLSRFPGADLG